MEEKREKGEEGRTWKGKQINEKNLERRNSGRKGREVVHEGRN